MGFMDRVAAWSQRNPVLDGMFLGVFVLALMIVLRVTGVASLSLLSTVVVVVAATVLGALLGVRRRRLLRRDAA